MNKVGFLLFDHKLFNFYYYCLPFHVEQQEFH